MSAPRAPTTHRELQARGLLLVVSAPSGAGKTSLVNALVARDDNLELSVSHTTRPRRSQEVDGVDYHFVAREAFVAMRESGQFLEHAEVFGNHYYGTARATVDELLGRGRDVILEIDWQGARQVRAARPDAVSIFIFPPSRASLIERLTLRNQDGEDAIRERSAKAVSEMSHHAEYDYLVVNESFEAAVADLLAIVRAERLRERRSAARLVPLIAELLSEGKTID